MSQLTHLLVIDTLSPQSYQNLVEEKEELDSYMYTLRFECYTENASWEKNMWAIKLSALLSGRGLDVFTSIFNEDVNDYKLKKALLTRYSFNENGCRRRFRDIKP